MDGLQEVQVTLSNDYWLSYMDFSLRVSLRGLFFFIGYDCSMVHGLTIHRSIHVRFAGSCNGMRLGDAW